MFVATPEVRRIWFMLQRPICESPLAAALKTKFGKVSHEQTGSETSRPNEGVLTSDSMSLSEGRARK